MMDEREISLDPLATSQLVMSEIENDAATAEYRTPQIRLLRALIIRGPVGGLENRRTDDGMFLLS